MSWIYFFAPLTCLLDTPLAVWRVLIWFRVFQFCQALIAQSAHKGKRATMFSCAVFLICLMIAGSMATSLRGLASSWYPRFAGAQTEAAVVGMRDCPGSAGQHISAEFIDAQQQQTVSSESCLAGPYLFTGIASPVCLPVC